MLLLGIIATAALPLLTTMTEKARDARADANAAALEAAVARYEMNHEAAWGFVLDPVTDELIAFNHADGSGFYLQLAYPTDKYGNVLDLPVGSSPGPYIYGPYITPNSAPASLLAARIVWKSAEPLHSMTTAKDMPMGHNYVLVSAQAPATSSSMLTPAIVIRRIQVWGRATTAGATAGFDQEEIVGVPNGATDPQIADAVEFHLDNIWSRIPHVAAELGYDTLNVVMAYKDVNGVDQTTALTYHADTCDRAGMTAFLASTVVAVKNDYIVPFFQADHDYLKGVEDSRGPNKEVSGPPDKGSGGRPPDYGVVPIAPIHKFPRIPEVRARMGTGRNLWVGRMTELRYQR